MTTNIDFAQCARHYTAAPADAIAAARNALQTRMPRASFLMRRPFWRYLGDIAFKFPLGIRKMSCFAEADFVIRIQANVSRRS